MGRADVRQVDLPDLPHAERRRPLARGVEVVELEDQHVAAVAAAAFELAPGRRVRLDGRHDLEERVAECEHGVPQPEQRHARVGIRLAEPELRPQALRDGVELGGHEHRLTQSHPRHAAYATRVSVVERTVAEGVALLTLNRPDRLNAWTGEMQRAYFDLLAEAGANDDVRVVVVTGAGRGFCAGADMQSLQDIGAGGLEQAAAGQDTRPQTFPLGIEKPVIAAINGPCAGIGLVQALMCDLRFAAADAKITTAFARRGLVAEHGMSWLLPRLVGPARALDLLLSARVVLGDEAERLGLVNRALPGDALLDETLAYARDLAANCAPSSMAAMKRQVYEDLERDLDEALARANELMVDSLQAPDFVEGVSSFVERRPPQFAPLARG